jgi:predicted transcriptional regulator
MTGKGRFLAGGISLIIAVGLVMTFGFLAQEAAQTQGAGLPDGDSDNELPGMGGIGYEDNYSAAVDGADAERSALNLELPWQLGVGMFLVGSSATLLVLFARLSSDDVLEGARKDIYEHIERNPGDHLANITRNAGISSSSVRHHLDVLEWSERIVSHKDGKLRHYYPNRNGYCMYTNGQGYKEVMSALRNPTAREMVKFLMANERANQRVIAAALGLHPSTVNWHANRLIAVSVISRSREGKDIHYSPNSEMDLTKVIALIEGDADIAAHSQPAMEGASS